jgi:integrase
MTDQELDQVLEMIKATPNSGDSAKLIFKLAAQSLTLDAFKNLSEQQPSFRAEKKQSPKGGKNKEKEGGIIKFSKEEIKLMPKEFQQTFIYDNKIFKYRITQGLFQARYRRDGYNIEVASKSYETMKKKFIAKLNGEDTSNSKPKAHNVKFGPFAEEWLKIKEQTTKATTFKEYVRMFNTNLKPKFGDMRIADITRSMIQDYLFEFVKEGKNRTAEKLKLQLTCIFDMAADDFGIPSPMKKIVLPHFESKKGSAFTKAEERRLIDFCIANKDAAASSALLVLLYFGLRQSELKSLKIIDGQWLQCETSKERMGRNVVLRKIPFTPVFKRVMEHVDFNAARDVNTNTVATTLKRLFPNHHPHELRYTFITRCKECGVSGEVVMLWDGHSQDKDVRTSAVDRGYTDYSEEFILAQAAKVDYQI